MIRIKKNIFSLFAIVWVGLLLFILSGCYLRSGETGDTDSQKEQKILSMYEDYKHAGFPGANDLTVDEILALKEKADLVFVDVREREEQAVSMIPGAIAYQEFDEVKEQYKNATIIAYCTIGSRSGDYTEKLIHEGFEAYNMAGSILMWTHKGQPLIRESQETNRAHVHGAKWDLLPEGYVSEY